MKQALLELALRRPRLIYLFALLLTLVLGLQIPRIEVDTDPENMLPAEQADRVFHNAVKAEMALHDAIVVGLVEPDHPDGIYTPASLGPLHRATERSSSSTASWRGISWRCRSPTTSTRQDQAPCASNG